MLSPLSAVQSNTRMTRSRAKSGTTPAKAPPTPVASPAQPSHSPVRKTASTPEPATPACVSNMPGAPPPTPASPLFFEAAPAATQLAELLGHALASVLPISEELQASATPVRSDLGGELARAMQDLVVDPMTVAQSPALGASPACVRGLIDSLPAWPTFEEQGDDEADEPVPLDDDDEISEQTEDDDMGVSRMKLNGMLPAGARRAARRALRVTPSHIASSHARASAHVPPSPHAIALACLNRAGFLDGFAPRANTHIVFEQSEKDELPQVDTTRAYGLFPAGALSGNVCSTSHVRFDEDEA
jgi:hypothetical protein